MLSRVLLSCSLLIALFGTSSAFSAGLSIGQDADFPYHIKSDSLSYDEATGTYMAEGHVTITRGDQVLSADAVDINMETMEADASGNVYFQSGQDWLKGDRLVMSLEVGTGTLYEGSLFIKESHFHIEGTEIEKSDEDTYRITDARFTTCDGDPPAWQIRAKDAVVEVEGYGKVKHATFRTRFAPILYTPYLLFPTSTQRETGFLVPQYTQSNKKGSVYSQPFFWAIRDNCDATLYETYMSRRGFKHGGEFRYALSSESKGAAMFDYLYDWKTDDGSGSGFEGYTGDDEDRTNQDRWWLRAKANQELPAGFRAKIDLDFVSDQDYLREFKTGHSGYNPTNDYFEKEFGRDLDVHTDTVRRNQLNLNKNWENYSLNTDFRWFDNVIIRKNDDPDPTLQTLPEIQFNSSRQPLTRLPVYFNFESVYDYFWRDYGTRGHQAVFHPRVYYPVRIFRHLDFEPSAGFRETVWYVDEYENEVSRNEDRFSSNEAPDFKADLSTNFTRIFQVNRDSLDRIKHTIRPQVIYHYVYIPSDSDRPDFDVIDPSEDDLDPDLVDFFEEDSLRDVNVVTYSITNFFSARWPRKEESDPGEQPDSTAQEPAPSYEYNDFCRLKVSQAYNINEARRDGEDSDRKPFSDVRGEVQVRPFSCLFLDADVAWSPYDYDFTSHNALLTFCDDRGDRVWLDYRYTKGWSNTIRTRILAKLFDPFWATWEYERNLREAKDVQTTIGLKYEPQCWSLAVSYADDREVKERKFSVEVGLYGLGEFGL